MRPVLVNRTLYEKIFMPLREGRKGNGGGGGRRSPAWPYDKYFSGPRFPGHPTRSALPARRGIASTRAFRPSLSTGRHVFRGGLARPAFYRNGPLGATEGLSK